MSKAINHCITPQPCPHIESEAGKKGRKKKIKRGNKRDTLGMEPSPPPILHREPGTMKSPFCIAPLLLLQFINLTWALPWDLPTCPLPAPPPLPAQHVLSPDVDGNSTRKKTDLSVTKIISFLLPRQTTCLTVTCNAQYYCCNDQTCGFKSNSWVCLWPTRTLTATSTYRSTSTSIVTTTRSFTSTTWDMSTTWTYVSSTSVSTKTITVTSTATETSLTTTSITLTKRGMTTPAPVRCVRRPEEEEEKRMKELVKRADPTVWVTTTIVVTVTPPSTYFYTTTWLYTYWITGQTTTTLTTYVRVDRTSTVTSTYLTTTATTSTVTETTTKAPGPSLDVKVGAGVGGGVGGLVVIALIAMLIWKKCTKPTAEEEWAGNQPVEDRNAPPGGAGPGMLVVGPGGVLVAAGATNKAPYKAGYYDQAGNVVVTETSPSPALPPVAHFQPAQYPQAYPGLSPPPFFFPSPSLRGFSGGRVGQS